MHAHHHDTAGQPAGSTASMISIIAPVVSLLAPSFALSKALSKALSTALSTVGRSPAVGTRRRNLQSSNLDKPGMSGRFGAWIQDSAQDSTQNVTREMGGRLRRRIEVSPH